MLIPWMLALFGVLGLQNKDLKLGLSLKIFLEKVNVAHEIFLKIYFLVTKMIYSLQRDQEM